MSTASARGLATAADLLSMRGDPFAEVVAGTVVEKASPSAEHGDAQLGLGGFLRRLFHRPAGGGGGGPGGWWILSEVEVELETHEVYRPDLVGWRRERVTARPTGRPVRARPDWVCEILSPTNARDDLVTKLRVYQRCAVPHYWIIDPQNQTLVIYKWQPDGYVLAVSAGRGDSVRAEPFEAAELRVGLLFGDDDPA
jgi:Uma2 family endonuclease